MVLLAKTQYQMFFLQDLRFGRRRNAARKEERMRIAVAERLEGLLPAQQFVVQMSERQFVIEMEPRLEIFLGQQLARRLPESSRKRLEVFLAHGQARCHFVSAKFFQMRSTLGQCFDQR